MTAVSSFRPLRWLGLALTGITLGASGSYLALTPQLPDISTLKEVRYETPLQVYTRDGKLISEFGVKHTIPLKYAEVPKLFIQAFLAAEDDRFFEHEGIDYAGLGRAFSEIVTTGNIRSGGSTITMQVAKNYFLSNERTFSRKLTEIMLAKRIEDSLTKQEILELYLNKIYLGQRAYGIGAAAKIYYGKTVKQLTLAEMAMIAGLPKAPSKYNPISNPQRALIRRDWILGRMLKLGYISKSAHAQAVRAPVGLNFKASLQDVQAPWLSEMVRESLLERFGKDVYDSGYKVYTTVSAAAQNAASDAVISGLLAYDQRHGWRGVEGSVKKTALKELRRVGNLEPAQVIKVSDQQITAQLRSGETLTLGPATWRWARKQLSVDSIGPAPRSARDLVAVDDIIRVQPAGKGWRLAQIPQVQGQLIAINPDNGAIEAVVGGFDFGQSKFNRAVQSWRQAGSTIKPLIYSKALERGYTPASLIDDAPLTFGDWEPSNSDGEFMGPITLRRALYLSRNLVSIRLLQAVGVDSAREYLTRFGLDKSRMPRDLTLALGSAEVLPIQMATAYAAIANGGLRVHPYFIEKVVDRQGKVVFQANPRRVCRPCELPMAAPVITSDGQAEAPEVIPVNPPVADGAIVSTDENGIPGMISGSGNDMSISDPSPTVYTPSYPVALRIMRPRAAAQMYSILQDVIRRGTGRGALSLGRDDLAGKTGTTNEARDAWFAGFNGRMVAVSWVGFDEPRSLGKVEYGGYAALPIWNQYMATALRGVPSTRPPMPAGMATARINRLTGEAVAADDPEGVDELFRAEMRPSPPPKPVDLPPEDGAMDGVNSPDDGDVLTAPTDGASAASPAEPTAAHAPETLSPVQP
ncbi:penicillin-binding protein 1A [Perlucidibaca piscinae]|uniref:penicillin-binding protein 1A n=1 Tax=Perlucidibaca piscinae TaxID=392589 RepID=UPI0003B42AF6|nr:penicillin-binding protein 1A [Perlucidibaca piscinae]